MKRIAFATSQKLSELTDDDRLMIEPLLHHDVHVKPLIWDAGDNNDQDYDSIVIRSCWDYHYKPEQFLEWIANIRRRGIPLWNPPRVVAWNLDKTYLRDLQKRGVMVPETIWLEKGAHRDLASILQEQDWQIAVVKPTISATAFNTFGTSRENARRNQRAFDEALSVSGMMVQRFMREVLTDGEWSLLFFDNKYSHAVLKRPKAGDFRVQEDFGGSSVHAVPPPQLIEDATQILSLIDEPLLFARVDGVEIDGRLCLMELELIEPALFLAYAPAAPQRFAEAIVLLC
jgi:hypothetical protein